MGPLLNLVAPAVALGFADYAVELFRELMMVRKVKHTVDARQGDSPLAQVRYAQAYGLVATARPDGPQQCRTGNAGNTGSPSR